MPASRSAPTGNGAANSLRAEDALAHDWYRFVLSFPPHLVRVYMERFGLGPSHLILDPFAGTGTTLVEAKKSGVPSRGLEAIPVARLAASTKANWAPDPCKLERHAGLVAEEAHARLAADDITDEPMTRTPAGRALASLPSESAKLLLKNSISPLPLHKALVLRAVLDDRPDRELADHERLALASILPTDVGNLRFGPEVGVGRVKQDAPVVEPWLSRVKGIAGHLRSLRDLPGAPSAVGGGDARSAGQHLEPGSVDAVITSPPYPNEKDYTRATRLESVVLGLMSTRADLRALKLCMLRSNSRGVYRGDDDDKWVEGHAEIARVADEIEERRESLGKTSGFERMYHRATRLYFGGMARHFASLSHALKPGARLAYVVGDQASYFRVMIRTGHLLAGVAERLGYEVDAIDLFRTRRATVTQESLREEVLVLRWPGGSKPVAK